MVFGLRSSPATLPIPVNSVDGLFSGLTSAWLSDPSGRLLVSAYAITFVTVTTRAVLQRRKQKKALREQQQQQAAEKQASEAETKKKTPAASPIKALLRRAMPKWKCQSAAWGFVLTVGIGLRTVVNIKVSSEIGVMGSLLAQRSWDRLFIRMLGYALYGLPMAVLVAFQKYAAANVALSLRTALMKSVHAGLGGATSLPRVFARAEQTAPPPATTTSAAAANEAAGGSAVQLATSDVDKYCTEVVTLYEGLIKPALEVVILSSTLGMMMGAKPLLACYGYFLLAGSWTRYVSPSFATMTERVQAAEGTLLDGHTRIHSYAEEVTMLNGAQTEAASLDDDLQSLRSAASHLSLQRFVSESLDGYVLRYLGILSAFAAMLPAVYTGVGARANADPTEYFLTCLHLLVNVSTCTEHRHAQLHHVNHSRSLESRYSSAQVGLALRDLVGSFKVAATARGYATRVESLYSAIDAIGPVETPSAAATSGVASAVLVLEGLSVATPEGTPLVNKLDLTVQKGQRVLLRGPNGAGKSSILRVIAGVWEQSGGRVKVAPPKEQITFLTQRAYVPERLSLRALLAYPDEPSMAEPDSSKLIAVLNWAGLDGVLDGLGGSLDTPVGKLSGGEMQRVAIARLRLHPPALAVMDEATANLEGGFEGKFFQWCAAEGMTVLTVSHNASLAAHHTHVLTLDDTGHYTFAKAS